jgi:hypothetical protein
MLDAGPNFARGEPIPISYDSVERGAALGPEPGTRFRVGAQRTLQDILVSPVRLCPASGSRFGSLQNYLSTETDRARCLKRGGAVEFVALDKQDAEDRYKLEPVDELTPEKVFAARWAMALLGEAMNRLRQEYAVGRNVAIFETLKAFLDVGNGKEPPTYEQAATALQVGVGAVKTLIHRLRKQYTVSVREEIGRTVANPAEIDAEIHELCQALVVAEGWILP